MQALDLRVTMRNIDKVYDIFCKLIFSFTLAAESFLRKRLLPSLHFFADTDLALISCEREELENARSACLTEFVEKTT